MVTPMMDDFMQMLMTAKDLQFIAFIQHRKTRTKSYNTSDNTLNLRMKYLHLIPMLAITNEPERFLFFQPNFFPSC
jgi:hypothetical protein